MLMFFVDLELAVPLQANFNDDDIPDDEALYSTLLAGAAKSGSKVKDVSGGGGVKVVNSSKKISSDFEIEVEGT